jgi:hypothetical protein
VTKGLHRYYCTRNLHFITGSCYRREPHLGTVRRRDLLLKLLEETRHKYRFVVHGYVLITQLLDLRFQLRRTGSGTGKLPGMAPGDQTSPAQPVWGWARAQSPTHSQTTRMSGAPGVAALFGAQGNFVANLFLGNSVSGLVNLGLFISGDVTPSAAQIASIPLKGAAQGIPMPPGNPGLSGAVGQLRGLGVQAAVGAGYNAIARVGAETIELGITAAGTVAAPVAQLSTETLSNVAFGVGVAKFGFDAGTFLYGYFVACHP